ncbi:PAS domain-containing protein [Mesorhizobium sp. L-8-10]|uniref:PAS domain-containing protein n=1 Tax=Mesorhizobium sp. L-8-10 TaxID=2744523 RepID=UPI0019271C90|nr:PAS domain-containing protein [Mesorhizobium sp. L-8-10]BCH32461.1 PAS domain-containing protein [Mesorhizobium sp. L-8-10]
MRQDGSIELFHYWNALRSGRPAPKRTEIEPSDIRSLLADTFILEKDTRGEAIFRLAGTRLCAIYGRELKGFAFSSLWKEKDQRLIARLAFSAFNMKSVVVITFSGVSRGRRTNPFELLLLPLDGGSESPRCMGIISAAARPFWLGADPVREAQIEAVRVVDPDREPVFLRNRSPISVPGLVPSVSSLRQSGIAPGSGRRIRHLVVLDGGREG